MKQFVRRNLTSGILFATILLMLCNGCSPIPNDTPSSSQQVHMTTPLNTIGDIPEYSGDAYLMLAESPSVTQDEIGTSAFEYYSDLDTLGRCGVTFANVCEKTMPTEGRESISSVKPSGWANAKYDFVDGGYVYNRCHLIGFQLTAENANEKNLITGTRYLNIEGMLPFENMVADYVRETDNHVLYRVTPVFQGDNLVASGVRMEGWSVEDEGDGISFDVYCYNVQPGVEIDYATGETRAAPTSGSSGTDNETTTAYVLNVNTKKFHLPICDSAVEMSKKNREDFVGFRSDLINQGYEPCGRCKP